MHASMDGWTGAYLGSHVVSIVADWEGEEGLPVRVG